MTRTATRKPAKKSANPSAQPQPSPGKLPRVPKGKRARFFHEPGVDQLFGIVTALSAELWAAYERIDTLERVLQQAKLIAPDAVEKHVPDEQLLAQRAAAREAFIQRVFQVLEDYA